MYSPLKTERAPERHVEYSKAFRIQEAGFGGLGLAYGGSLDKVGGDTLKDQRRPPSREPCF